MVDRTVLRWWVAEVRQPLNVLVNAVEILERQNVVAPAGHETVEMIRRQIGCLRTLVDEIERRDTLA
jgi:hypothetical protein